MSTLRSLFERLHRDERGDIPVGQLAVIGLIVIPLVIALIVFRTELLEWLRERWDEFTGADPNATF